MDIKNSNLIVSHINNELVIKNTFNGNPTKLGHVLNYLPNGIIDKSITGLGGTTLELDCERNSIIVEPLKFTAESKANHPSLNNKYKIFNFAVPKKSFDLGFMVTDILLPAELEDKFNDYLKYCKKNDQPLKFICVSDQLGKLKNYINQIEDLKFEDFHLLIDEIDSMQLQSDFRNVMHYVMEIYKEHPHKNRTLLSATLTKFHDPKLNDEPFLKITYENPILIYARVLVSNNVEYRTAVTILDLNSNYPNEKILIAYNHIEGIKNVIDFIIKNGINNNDIAVLYSSSKRGEFNENKKAKISNETLPAKINFITAAYFSGFDLNENAHLIITIDPTTLSMTISPSTAYQIQGRLRKGALSTSLVVNFIDRIYKEYNITELITASNVIKNIIKNLDEAIKTGNPFLEQFGLENKKWILEGNNKFPSILIVDNETQCIDISYMKMDSIIDQQLTKVKLGNQTNYMSSLSQFFKVIDVIQFDEDKKTSRVDDTQELVSELIKEINKIHQSRNHYLVKNLLKNIDSGRSTSRNIINMYLDIIPNDLFVAEKFIKKLKQLIKDKKWGTQFKFLKINIDFHILFSLSEQSALNNFLTQHYKLNNDFTTRIFNERHLNAIESVKPICEKSKKHSALITKLKSVNSFENKIIGVKNFKKGNERYKKITTLDPFDILNTEKYPKFKLRKK